MFRSQIPTPRAASSIFRLRISASNVRPVSSAGARATSIGEEIKEDHRELETYYNNIVKATDEDTKIRYQNQFIWELARHSVGEELLLYPAFEKHLGDGKERTKRDREEHQKVKNLLKHFQNLTPSEQTFIPTMEALMGDLRQHINEEESDDLPAIENALSLEESRELSRSFGRTKMFVPTRSHPLAPDKPPFETAIGLMTAPIDHLGDLFRRFPKE